MCKCGSQMYRVLTWVLKSFHQIFEWTLFADLKVLCLKLYEICREYNTTWERTVDAGCWTVLVITNLSFVCPHNNNIITFPLWWQVKLLKLKIWNKSDSHVKFTPLLCCQLSLIIKNEHQTWILAIQHASNTPIPKKTAWWLSLDWLHLRISSVDSKVKTIFHNTVPQESNAFYPLFGCAVEIHQVFIVSVLEPPCTAW